MVKWLERIFSIQSISLIVTIVAAYIGYRSYIANKPAELTIEFLGEELEFEEKTEMICILELIKGNKQSMDIEDVLLPLFKNSTDKALINFKCEIDVGNRMDMAPSMYYYANDFIKREDNYEYVDDPWAVTAKYKKDILHPHSYIPYPFSKFGKKEPHYDTEEFFFTYDINYEGCKTPIMVEVFLEVYDGNIASEQIKESISERGYFWKYDQCYNKNVDWIYVVANDINQAVVKRADCKDKRDFEELADDFISDVD